jgi:hypothetical protein
MNLAEFVISSVEYDHAGKLAVRLCLHYNLVNELASPFWIERDPIIRTIREGYYVSVASSQEIKAKKFNRRVHVINVDGIDYLRTDQERIAEDSLGIEPKGTVINES